MKRNQARQSADVDVNVDSHRNTKMKDPSSKEGGYREILDEPMWRVGTEGPHQ